MSVCGGVGIVGGVSPLVRAKDNRAFRGVRQKKANPGGATTREGRFQVKGGISSKKGQRPGDGKCGRGQDGKCGGILSERPLLSKETAGWAPPIDPLSEPYLQRSMVGGVLGAGKPGCWLNPSGLLGCLSPPPPPPWEGGGASALRKGPLVGGWWGVCAGVDGWVPYHLTTLQALQKKREICMLPRGPPEREGGEGGDRMGRRSHNGCGRMGKGGGAAPRGGSNLTLAAGCSLPPS